MGVLVRLRRQRQFRAVGRRLSSAIQSAAAAVPRAAAHRDRPHQRVVRAHSRGRLLRRHHQHGSVRHAFRFLLRLLRLLGFRLVGLRCADSVLAVPLHRRDLQPVLGAGLRHRRLRRRHRRLALWSHAVARARHRVALVLLLLHRHRHRFHLGRQSRTRRCRRSQVMPILAAEAQKASNWKTALPPNLKLLVALRQLDPTEAGFRAASRGNTCRSASAPFLSISRSTRSEARRPAMPTSSPSRSPASVLTKTRDLQEPFAPSQFRNFDDATKLSQPAFVPQDSGIELAGSATLRVGNRHHAAGALRPHRGRQRVRAGALPVLRALARDVHQLPGRKQRGTIEALGKFPRPDAAAAPDRSRCPTRHSPSRCNRPTRSFIPRRPAFLSQAKAQDYIANAVAADPSLEGTLHVIPQFEVAA